MGFDEKSSNLRKYHNEECLKNIYHKYRIFKKSHVYTQMTSKIKKYQRLQK